MNPTPPDSLYIWAVYVEIHPYTPGTMCKKHCSSQEFLHKTLFIPILFFEIIIYRINPIENPDTIHNILTLQTGTVHYSYWRQFFLIF